MMRSNCLIMIMLALLLSTPPCSAGGKSKDHSIKEEFLLNLSVHSRKANEVATFAVAEHDHISHANLRLVQILSCTKIFHTDQSGTFALLLLAKDEDDNYRVKKFFARVYQGNLFYQSRYQLQKFESRE
ncbi:hypothetical protein HN51_003890 [Arachis hypogaea]|nr:uncharacterized protein DS421_4g111470 [Arachis hypogaea]